LVVVPENVRPLPRFTVMKQIRKLALALSLANAATKPLYSNKSSYMKQFYFRS